MKKVAFVIGMIILLVGALMGGFAFGAKAGGGPTLNVSGNSAPGRVDIVGHNWAAGAEVDLYMDFVDVGHWVSIATPASTGVFNTGFTLGATRMGGHQIIGKQGGTTVIANWMIKSSQPVDDRSQVPLDTIYQDATIIVGKVDLAPAFATDSFSLTARNSTGVTDVQERSFTYPSIRHVSLTVWSQGIVNPTDGVAILPSFDQPSRMYVALDTITAVGVKNYQFDTDAWELFVTGATPNVDVTAHCEVTTTAKMP